MMIHRPLFIAALVSSLAAAPGVAQEGDGTRPDGAAALRDKAFQLYRAGRYPECAEVFERSARAAGSGRAAANAFYNAGCCHALNGDVDRAFAMLRLAVEAGYTDFVNMVGDADLASLRGDPRMEALLEPLRPKITENLRHDAGEAEFVYDDAENFMRAMELVSAGADLEQTLEAEYFARATPGLKQMVVKYPFTAAELAEAIERHPDEYARIGETVSTLKAREADCRAAYRRLQEVAPDVVFPPTYFLVDRYRGIGSGSPDGQLITIEKWTVESIGHVEALLVHELLHFQQLVATGPDEFYAIFGPKRTLLALTIREGAAEFFADKVTGRMTQQDAVDYCLENEAEVWRRFRQRMHDDETDGWMWSAPDDPEIPRDLAYVLGARIVKSYYDRADDKRKAVKEILAVTDYPAFLQKSGYGDQWVLED
jgi:hypothetical protein